MRLWDWALAAYAAPGAQPALLGLQDEQGQSVCLLLWAAWSAGADADAAPPHLAEAAALARAWERETASPLRAARRALKGDWPGVDPAGRDALRNAVKAAELAGERLLLEALEALAPRTGAINPTADGLARALVAAAAAFGPSPPKALLERLARIFERLDFC